MSARLRRIVDHVWTEYIREPADAETIPPEQWTRLRELVDERVVTLWQERSVTHDRITFETGAEAIHAAVAYLGAAEDEVLQEELFTRIPHRRLHNRMHRWALTPGPPADAPDPRYGRAATRQWLDLAGSLGTDVDYATASERDGVGIDPIEDLALPPTLYWTEADKKQALDKCLAIYRPDPWEWLDIEWPPEAGLWDPGSMTTAEVNPCEEHGEDGFAAECEDCAEPIEESVDTPAVWRWHTVLTEYTLTFDALGRQVEQEIYTDRCHEVAETEQDPRDVLLGPPRGRPDRMLMEQQLRYHA